MEDLTVILPAYNEEKTVGLVIDEIKSLYSDCRILVVDNASTDNTRWIAKERGVDIVEEPRRGKGNAMKLGFMLADTPYIIMMDSDYTYPARGIGLIYSLLERYDVVIGYRALREKSSMVPANVCGNHLLSLLASIMFGYRVYDVCSGMWGFSKEALSKFRIGSKGFTLEVDLFANSVNTGCTIGQIPIVYRPRPYGSIGKLKVSDGIGIGWFLLRKGFEWA